MKKILIVAVYTTIKHGKREKMCAEIRTKNALK